MFLIMPVVITAMVCLAFSAGALDATGQCVDNVYWTFDEATGELVISGSGEMWDYSFNTYEYFSPFYWNREFIKSLVVKSGVTSIGDNAYYSKHFLHITDFKINRVLSGQCLARMIEPAAGETDIHCAPDI